MTFTANNGCTYCGSDGHMQSVCPWKTQLLTATGERLDAIAGIPSRAPGETDADLRARILSRHQPSAAQSAPDEREAFEAWLKSNWSEGLAFAHAWARAGFQAGAAWQRAQSAPVVLPPQCTDKAQHVKYRNGWNSCLSEVARMNRARSAPAVREGWQIVGYASKSKLAPLLDPTQPDGGYITIGLDHPTLWLEDTPYEHLVALYIAAPQPGPIIPAELTSVSCQCGREYAHDSYDAGFIAGSGMCQLCDASLPAQEPAARQEQGDEVLPHWAPCNPACDPELNGFRDRHCKCEQARAALSASAEGKA